MTTVTPAAASGPLTAVTGVGLDVESTAFAAGNTIAVSRNLGNTVLHVNATTPGTGTIKALVVGDDVPVTIVAGDNLFGPFDQETFGYSFNVTTATAVGSAALYRLPDRASINGARNPFEADLYKADAN